MESSLLQSFVSRIPVDPLPRVLERLVSSNREAGTEPYATVILRSGVPLSGWIIGGHRPRSGAALESLLLQGAGPNGQRTEQLTFVAAHDVVAVRFEALETVVEHLAQDVIDPAELQTPPGRLEVLRRIEQVKAEVATAFARRLTLSVEVVQADGASERTLTLLAAWLPALTKALVQLGSDQGNQAEILALIDRVVVIDGSAPAAVRDGRSLMLTLPCGSPARRAAADLVRLIESAL